jgi:hypothetical protein
MAMGVTDSSKLAQMRLIDLSWGFVSTQRPANCARRVPRCSSDRIRG